MLENYALFPVPKFDQFCINSPTFINHIVIHIVILIYNRTRYHILNGNSRLSTLILLTLFSVLTLSFFPSGMGWIVGGLGGVGKIHTLCTVYFNHVTIHIFIRKGTHTRKNVINNANDCSE